MMYQLVGLKWLLPAILLGIIVYLGLEKLFLFLSEHWSWMTLPSAYRLAGMITLGIVSFTMAKWRWLWRCWVLGPQLSKQIFPDLNGEYEVTLRSNWPTIKRLVAAEGPESSSNESCSELDEPELQSMKLHGRIEQSFFRTSIILSPIGDSDPINQSRTLSCTLHKEARDGLKRLSYVYEQTNRKRANTDEEKFFGAGDVHYDPNSEVLLSGNYWTNRAWRKGLNTAGEIEFRLINPK